jgi:tripartite-type tricarboxylate transporter receptor subunit TctC
MGGNMQKAIMIVVAVIIGFGLSVPGESHGKEVYPTKPIEIVVPFPPGTTMDSLARLIGQTAPKYLGQPVILLNKTGGGGSPAAAEVIASKPDGYKLMMTTNFFFASTTKTQKVPFNPYLLVPIANFLEYRNGMLVKGDSPFKTLNDLLDFGKKNPGTLRWGHSGRGISQHLYGLLLFRKAKVDTIEIPYKGSPEMIAAVMGGHIDAAFITYGATTDHVRNGTLRYLITVGDKRYSNSPTVPCATELGYPELTKLPTYVGLYAHKDTPEPIKKRLLDAMTKTYQDAEFQKRLEALGEEAKFAGPDAMRETIKVSEAAAEPILKELGLYVEGK